MGGCFSGQKELESENAPVQAPASPRAAVSEPTTAAPTTENIVETQKEEPLVDISETKEEVKKEAEVEAEPVAAPTAEENAPEDVKEETKVAQVPAASFGTEDKTSAAPAAL